MSTTHRAGAAALAFVSSTAALACADTIISATALSSTARNLLAAFIPRLTPASVEDPSFRGRLLRAPPSGWAPCSPRPQPLRWLPAGAPPESSPARADPR